MYPAPVSWPVCDVLAWLSVSWRGVTWGESPPQPAALSTSQASTLIAPHSVSSQPPALVTSGVTQHQQQHFSSHQHQSPHTQVTDKSNLRRYPLLISIPIHKTIPPEPPLVVGEYKKGFFLHKCAACVNVRGASAASQLPPVPAHNPSPSLKS